jgi:predicted AAA+ superfamily ATPase
MFQRLLEAPKESALLLGPRATGKSTWLAQAFKGAATYDLLDTRLALQLARDPGQLAREVGALPPKQWVVIDEVQKVPELLDEVHRLMERDKRRFLLSGSSARKLKRGGANLLAGRALRLALFPLVSQEVGGAPSLERISFGMLPRVFTSDTPRKHLEAYAQTYVKEEVQAEALTRNIGGFARFLEVAARQNGQVTNASNIARDAQVARQTVQGYFDVLVDTLLGEWLPAWKLKRATKLVAHPKFHFFDAGVARALSERLAYPPTAEEQGFLFETYLLAELRAYLSYSGLGYVPHYFRTHDAVEVDVVLETARGHVALEFKSSREWRSPFGKGFARLSEEIPRLTCIGAYAGERALKTEYGMVYPYAEFLRRLWDGALIR